jgi:hypothetical protein
MDDDLQAVFDQFHVPSPRGSSFNLLRQIDEKAEEYAEIHQRQAVISGLGTAGRDFSKAVVEIKAKTELTAAERESRLEEALRTRKEREDRLLAIEVEREKKAEELRATKRLRSCGFRLLVLITTNLHPSSQASSSSMVWCMLLRCGYMN